ncbi:riboflavin synthase [Chloropicon primus]|uniref:Riboflavin synthase n=1 Tax=Chloropicon primus TaxID=1764295 RepID=A0A5B8MIH7_9CHLO|nr:riboflavin synthase [Chloropicon primus]UPQ99462.1 riboflavin synthase [Chloropicon primus]|eukprot:QDZ20253.1 riboflavin synthase [Chloropicon primus]
MTKARAEVASVVDKDEFRSLVLRFPPPREEGRNYLERAQVGCSVAVNGTCLTVTTIAEERNELGFDVIGETLRRTNLGTLAVGDECNFERAARIGDEVGGHNVSGHVHTKAEVSEVERVGENNVRYQVRLPTREYIKYVLPKGYIAVDGISLTVGEVDDQEGTFNLYLIPETLRVTTLGTKTPGSAVNVEVDAQTQAIVDTVEKMRQRGDF